MDIIPFDFNNQVVATYPILAEFLGTQESNLTSNFNRNKNKFTEGKHYFKLSHLEVTQSDVQNYSGTKGLILWTEKGCARHSKLLETDQAWELWEDMEEVYFSDKKQTLTLPELPKNFAEALRLAADLQEENEEQQKQIQQKNQLIIASNEASIKAGEILVGEFCKSVDIIDIGPTKFYKWMRKQELVFKNSCEPIQKYRDRGFFTWKPTKEQHGGRFRYTLRVTPRGKIWLAAKYMSYLDNEMTA